MILEKAFREYKANLRAAFAFGLLLLFVPVFLLGFFQSENNGNLFFKSGSFFIEYNAVSHALLALETVLFFFFLLFFSFFVSLMAFGVRRDLSAVRVEYYLSQMVQKFTVKIFLFFALYSLVFSIAGFLLVSLMDPLAGTLIGSLALLIGSMLFLFVPQAIVVDEVGVFDGMRESIEFISKNVNSFFIVLATGAFAVAIVILLEFVLDLVFLEFLPGRFVSVFLMLVFVVPFMEALKTYLYMFKFDLVKKSELAKHQNPD